MSKKKPALDELISLAEVVSNSTPLIRFAYNSITIKGYNEHRLVRLHRSLGSPPS